MIQLTTLTDNANQQTTVGLADGSIVTLTLTYRATIQRWSLDLQHESIQPNGEILGLNLCTHPNILRAWRNVISFGIGIVSTDGFDPVSIEDFISGRITIYILDATATIDEVQGVEQNVFGQYAPGLFP